MIGIAGYLLSDEPAGKSPEREFAAEKTVGALRNNNFRQTTCLPINFVISMVMLIGRVSRRLGIPLLLIASMVCPVAAQKINFGAYTTSQGLSLPTSAGLNFGVIVTNSPAVVVGLDNSAWLEIDGDATRDITIIVPSLTYLTCGTSEIPFTCQFAYSNFGFTDPYSAKLSAVQISPGVTVITIPMLQRTGGVPAPPPTPAHGGYTAPSAKAYLFLYGTLGPVGSVSSGAYSGMINVFVDYTTY